MSQPSELNIDEIFHNHMEDTSIKRSLFVPEEVAPKRVKHEATDDSTVLSNLDQTNGNETASTSNITTNDALNHAQVELQHQPQHPSQSTTEITNIGNESVPNESSQQVEQATQQLQNTQNNHNDELVPDQHAGTETSTNNDHSGSNNPSQTQVTVPQTSIDPEIHANDSIRSNHNIDHELRTSNDVADTTQAAETASSVTETTTTTAPEFPNERENLVMIAGELEEATEANKQKNDGKNDGKNDKTVLHDGIQVPANSELLNTNAAVAAYNALSSQLPTFSGTNAHLAALPLPIVAADYLPPRIQLLINTLPTLDNLATQLLRIVAIGPYQKIIDLASNPDTPAGATYRDLSSLFEFTRRLYSEEYPFLTVEHIAPGMWKEGEKTPSMFRNREQSIESTLRKVNLATFLAATLGTIDAGFFYLNESFLDIFCPNNNLDPNNALSNMGSNSMSLQSGVNTAIGERVGKLLKPQAVLYLDLKTQAYISAIEAGERSRLENLNDLLPDDLEQYLLSRRGTKTLSPTELDFIDRCKARKETLLHYPDDKVLSEEYEWFSFVKDLFDYVGKNMGFIIYGKKGRSPLSSRKEYDTATPHSQEILNAYQDSSSLMQSPKPDVPALPTTDGPMDTQAISEITNALLPSEIQEQQLHLRINPGSTIRNLQRRPWTREEEKALRHALELKGPQWSTILELFGNGGKISEALKNRTQVQLKDKARNWKMFFLKSGLPVPGYLQRVTGDLEREDRTRNNRKNTRNKKTAAAPVPSVQQNK